MKFIITPKPNYYTSRKPGCRGYKLGIAIQQFAAIQAQFDSRDALEKAVLIPAFVISGIRDGNPDRETLNHTYKNLVKCGTVIEV